MPDSRNHQPKHGRRHQLIHEQWEFTVYHRNKINDSFVVSIASFNNIMRIFCWQTASKILASGAFDDKYFLIHPVDQGPQLRRVAITITNAVIHCGFLRYSVQKSYILISFKELTYTNTFSAAWWSDKKEVSGKSFSISLFSTQSYYFFPPFAKEVHAVILRTLYGVITLDNKNVILKSRLTFRGILDAKLINSIRPYSVHIMRRSVS